MIGWVALPAQGLPGNGDIGMFADDSAILRGGGERRGDRGKEDSPRCDAMEGAEGIIQSAH